MNRTQPLVCWFREVNKDAVALVGGKCASLGELINAGVRVPPGFAVTTAAYERFIAEAGLTQDLAAAIEGLDDRDLTALEAASSNLRRTIEAASFTLELEDLIAEYYRKLSKLCYMPATPVAVRSSATAEDLPGASFAGQQDTFLWIRGVDDLLEHVKRCFSSLFTPRAIAYRIKMGFDHAQVGISVGVQKMANSFTAGVMFTLNPSNGDRSQIVIDANFGFGESVVSGEITPDHFVLDKVTLEIVERVICKKDFYYSVDPVQQSSKRYEQPLERQTIQSTRDEDLIELARMGKAIEKHYGRPQDIEWAVDKDMPAVGNVFILQSRPETVWSARKPESVVGGKKVSAMESIVASLLSGKKVS
ncbi:MAG: PEP/pyruvate-binding domain-containing protein [Thermodesulfobacteriota bacterium]